jgi:predicted DsbA family dithiol-disulfide isomerase
VNQLNQKNELKANGDAAEHKSFCLRTNEKNEAIIKTNKNMEIQKVNSLTLEIWTDFMCPLCYIGKTNLENALREFPDKDKVKVTYHPFQLFPDAPSNTGKNYYDYTSMTHGGLSVEYVKEGNARVVDLANSIGLQYNLDRVIPTNTMDALRIGLYAQEKGKAKEWTSRTYRAYFTEGLNIGDAQTLAKLGSETGLDAREILKILSGDKYKSMVQAERLYGLSIGVQGVPFFVLNNRTGVSGVRSKEEFLSILNKVWSEGNPGQLSDISEGQSCDINGKCE